MARLAGLYLYGRPPSHRFGVQLQHLLCASVDRQCLRGTLSFCRAQEMCSQRPFFLPPVILKPKVERPFIDTVSSLPYAGMLMHRGVNIRCIGVLVLRCCRVKQCRSK